MGKDNFQYNIPKLSLNERINFFSEFHSYLGSSIPLTTALSNMQTYSNSTKIKRIAITLLREIDNGENFADVILKFKNTIGNVYCNLMSIGAQSGELPKILKDIHSSLKKQRTTLYTLIRASIYPAILFIMLIGASLLLLFFIAPRLANQYQNATGEALTENMNFLQNLAMGLSSNIFFIVFVFVLIIISAVRFFKYLLKSELGVKLPVIGAVIRYYNLSTFSKLLAIAYAAGMPITHGILLACEPLTNGFIQKKLFKCSTFIAKHSLADSFAGTGFFTPQMISKLQAGEQTGRLDETLQEISNEINETLETVISSALQMFEPVLMTVIAVFLVIFGSTLMNTIFML